MNSRNASLFALGLAVMGVVFLVLKGNLISSNPFGIGLQIAAAGLMVWARIVFGRRSFHAGANATEGGLVTRGPYRYLRHPIYAALSYFILGGITSHPSLDAIIVAAVVVSCLAIRMLLEEQSLIEKYPEYKEYSKRTKRVLPFVF
jgi:protein-S-isoprenylcysteine O-methyltransferase Ste14